MVVAGGYSSSRADMQIWNVTTATQVREIHRASDYYFLSTCFLSEQNQVWATDYNFKGQIIDIEEGFSIRKIDLNVYSGFSQADPVDPNIVIVGDANEKIRLFDVRKQGNDAALIICPALGSFQPSSITRKASSPNNIFVGTVSGVKQVSQSVSQSELSTL